MSALFLPAEILLDDRRKIKSSEIGGVLKIIFKANLECL
jgi:hypothetical protein